MFYGSGSDVTHARRASVQPSDAAAAYAPGSGGQTPMNRISISAHHAVLLCKATLMPKMHKTRFPVTEVVNLLGLYGLVIYTAD